MSRSTYLMLTLLLTSFCYVSLAAPSARTVDAFRKQMRDAQDAETNAAMLEAERKENARLLAEQVAAEKLAQQQPGKENARLLAEQVAAEKLA